MTITVSNLSDFSMLFSGVKRYYQLPFWKLPWLDRCISTNDGHSIINTIDILYRECFADHFPLNVALNTHCIPIIVNCNNANVPKLKWDKLQKGDLNEYNLVSDNLLQNISIPVEAITCKYLKCNDKTHVDSLNVYNDDITKCLTEVN